MREGCRCRAVLRRDAAVVLWFEGRNEEIPGVTLKLSQSSSTARRAFTGIFYMEQVMSMNKDQVKGRVKEAEGKIKEVAGKLVGNENLEAKGKVQKNLGEAQAKFGDVKKDVKDLAKGK
jgi:uncharacterized protein YjbJ (UPF0337 family)